MRCMVLAATLLLTQWNTPGSVAAETPAASRLEKLISTIRLPGLVRSSIGVTRLGTPIPCYLSLEDVDPLTSKFRILLIGGMDGETGSVAGVLAAAAWFQALPADDFRRKAVLVSCVPCANPDGWANGKGDKNLSQGQTSTGFPPQGNSYQSATHPENQYLWRWIGMHAPDLVIDVRKSNESAWLAAKDSTGFSAGIIRQMKKLGRPIGKPIAGADELVVALGVSRASDIGTIPAVRVHVDASDRSRFLPDLVDLLRDVKAREVSPARREMRRRVRRSALEIASELAKHYGHDLRQVVYIPSLALMGRVRLGELTGNSDHLRDVERIVSPYFSGKRPSMGQRVSGSALSGHLVFSQLARRTKKARYVELARQAADLGFKNGKMLESMPAHSEMSDAVFMGCPILAETGQLTGDPKYFAMCVRHLQFMQKHCLRPDGLYRHSPLDDTAWGRGNGFPALGLALSLSAMPANSESKRTVQRVLQNHLRVLLKHQDPSGAWHQVVDRPESYRELTSTCMITFAMIRGVREGALKDSEFRPAIRRAWRAIQTRVGADGNLVDVCTGTGKQRDLRAYYDRTAILGRDARGGAMALMVTTEMAMWRKDLPLP